MQHFCVGRVVDLSSVDNLFFLEMGEVFEDFFVNTDKSFACESKVRSSLEEGELVIFSIIDGKVVDPIPTGRKIDNRLNKIVLKT